MGAPIALIRVRYLKGAEGQRRLKSRLKVKGFAEPIRCYKVQGLYDQLAEEGTVIREEQEGFKFHLNLQKRHKAEAISILEGILSRLKA